MRTLDRAPTSTPSAAVVLDNIDGNTAIDAVPDSTATISYIRKVTIEDGSVNVV